MCDELLYERFEGRFICKNHISYNYYPELITHTFSISLNNFYFNIFTDLCTTKVYLPNDKNILLSPRLFYSVEELKIFCEKLLLIE